MSKMLQVVFIVSVTMFTMSQSISYFSYLPGTALYQRSFPRVFAADNGRTPSNGEDVGHSRVLGFIDHILLKQLISKSQETTVELATVKDRLNTVTSDLLIVKGIVDGLTKPTSIGRMPTSCGDLKNLGNIKSGLFNIKSDMKVATVYCDFTKPSGIAGFQQWIGYVDVKSVPVYFYVQQTTTVTSVPKITFIAEKLNVGNAMDISTGMFTAPVDGTYFFSFSSTVDLGTGFFFSTRLCVVQLTLNDVVVGNAEINGFPYINNQLDSLHLEATLSLKKGDQVWLKSNIATDAALLGNDFTVFTGMLLEEVNFP